MSSDFLSVEHIAHFLLDALHDLNGSSALVDFEVSHHYIGTNRILFQHPLKLSKSFFSFSCFVSSLVPNEVCRQKC